MSILGERNAYFTVVVTQNNDICCAFLCLPMNWLMYIMLPFDVISLQIAVFKLWSASVMASIISLSCSRCCAETITLELNLLTTQKEEMRSTKLCDFCMYYNLR